MGSNKFTFKGLMAPVFTPFLNDRANSINYDVIPKYVKYLKSQGLEAILVNGTSGEGPALSLIERKEVAKVWHSSCKANDIKMMLQIGGAPLPDVISMAEDAQALRVDAVLCLPELYFKPKTEACLVRYLQKISQFCSTTPIFYYHIPMFSNVNLHMPTFIELAKKAIPMFGGIKYTSNDLDQGTGCLGRDCTVFLGADTIWWGALAQGFDSAIMTTLNICPLYSKRLQELSRSANMEKGLAQQRELNEEVQRILSGGTDWVSAMKRAFNELNLGFSVGGTRMSLKN